MSRKWLYLVAVVVLIVVFTIWSKTQPAATVEVIRPQTKTIRAYVEERAVTELPHDYLIATPISGWLEPIELREGDPVKEGQVLSRLDTDDLADHVRQAEQRIAVLETRIKETRDHRLENNALIETKAMVKAIDETVQAAEAKLEASLAVVEFAKTEVDRYAKISEQDAAADRELRSAETAYRKAKAEYQSDVLEFAALKTLAAVSYRTLRLAITLLTPSIDRAYSSRSTWRPSLKRLKSLGY